MSNYLQYLTIDDRTLLMEKGKCERFEEGSIILERGSTRKAIYVILKGLANITLHHLGNDLVIASVENDEIFGEISFIDGTFASATVIAAMDCEILVIEEHVLNSLLHSTPGFASRFYQSIALKLANIIRDLNDKIPNFMVENIAQVERNHREHVANEILHDVPQELVKRIDVFKNAMVKAEKNIINLSSNKPDKNLNYDKIRYDVFKACDGFKDDLTDIIDKQGKLSSAIGSYALRETFNYFMSSQIIDRCYTKPRGFAGDYGTITQIYDNLPTGAGRLGPIIDEWTLNFDAAKAVRARRDILNKLIKDEIESWPDNKGEMPITSLASGPAVEVLDLFEASAIEHKIPNVKITLVDIDDETLEYCSENINAISMRNTMLYQNEDSIENHISIVKDNIVRMSLRKGATKTPPQHFIYSMGLIDYLADYLVVQLMNWCFDNLSLEGKVILGNFSPASPDKAFMDHILEWVIIYRDEKALKALFAKSKFGSAKVEIMRDETGVQLLACCQKA